MISIIVAVSRNGVIGAGGQLPWRLPADLKRFQQLTLGHAVIMGRKTFEAIGKPLAGRTNIVVTRRKDFNAPGCQVAHSLEEALSLAKTACHSRPRSEPRVNSSGNPPSASQEVFVIGGSSIYGQALPLANRIYLTEIHQNFEGDTYFRRNKSAWKEISRETHAPDRNNRLSYSFVALERNE